MENDLSLDALNLNLSSVLNSSKIQVQQSFKSTESVDNLEMNFMYDNIETLEQESEPCLTIRDLILSPDSNNTLAKYQKCLLSKPNSRKLFRNFLKEKFRLVKSETKTLDYSIKEILLRLKGGYVVYKYKRKVKQRRQAFIVVEDSVLKIKSNNSRFFKRIPFESVLGIIFGCETYSFKNNKEKIDKVCGRIHNQHDCFSVVTDSGSYDFACGYDKALFDICIGVSWLAFHYNSSPCAIPYSKCEWYVDSLTVTVVCLKIKEMADAKYVSTVELFLLSICKTLKDLKKDYTPILSILNKRYTGDSKLFRFISKSLMPIINKQQCKENLINLLKANYLASSTNQTEKTFNDYSQILKKNNKPEKSPFNFVAFFVPDNTGMFNKPKDKNRVIFSKNSSNFTTIRYESGKSPFRTVNSG